MFLDITARNLLPSFPRSAVRGRVLAAAADEAEIADQLVGEPDVSHLMATACFLVR